LAKTGSGFFVIPLLKPRAIQFLFPINFWGNFQVA